MPEEKDKPDEVDAAPLVTRLLEKTVARKLKWEPTADTDTFLATVEGSTFRLSTIYEVDVDPYGNPETVHVPALALLNEKGKVLWMVTTGRVKGGLWKLHEAARRVAHKLDERLAAAIEALDRL